MTYEYIHFCEKIKNKSRLPFRIRCLFTSDIGYGQAVLSKNLSTKNFKGKYIPVKVFFDK